MEQVLDRRRLVPPGFSVLSSEITENGVKFVVAPDVSFGSCPCCGSRSKRIQSRYRRRAADLPIAGRNVELIVFVRRFWCEAVLCG